MQLLSVFDMFKIGMGPSSSHTMGPWRAAQRFVEQLRSVSNLHEISRVTVELYGSLAKTGKGHGTDIALQLGLAGEDPETYNASGMSEQIESIRSTRKLCLGGIHEVDFDPSADILFRLDEQLPFHPNAMRFTAYLNSKQHAAVFYSTGGGFIVEEGESPDRTGFSVPYPVSTAAQLLNHCRANDCRIAHIVMQNELSWRSDDEIRRGLARIRDTMLASIHRGCRTDGILPGGLSVHRRAAWMTRKLLGQACPASMEAWAIEIHRQSQNFRTVLDWVSCFALAVNEENAAFGRIVTAPTNGSAGVIPAVLMYCLSFCDATEDATIDFLLTAGQIGSIFKQGATISAAMGGCQAEIGVSSAMAAAALTEALGGSTGQVVEAAEIAMEHHLGLTCDPVGGLVQIPCIERNAMGAVKAILASQMALHRDPAKARVTLDDVVRTMWQTALDMNAKYKETSEGGLAVQIAVNVSEC